MIVLGIETSAEIGSVALCDEDGTRAAYTFPEGARHARDIVPAVDRIVKDASIGRSDVGAVAVSQGPGSFTGLRVGVTCAKTLAYALGWKAVGIPSLEVVAQNVVPDSEGRPELTCPLRDARRERVYGTIFEWDGEAWQDTTGVLIREPAALAEMIPVGALILGTGVRAYPEVFETGGFHIGDRSLEVGHAEAAARLGLREVQAGRDVDPMALVPRYYRLTEAEEKLQAGAP
ncbi:MAG: tRNA (adenosine(37)-N6)-threonylcarbamoyltransferase complex dimerization subunit type 1 TsaB [Planctomycetota bacterium]|jgi:tRNA threonylcarbamoyladenosine biosynthesis protein TsaB